MERTPDNAPITRARDSSEVPEGGRIFVQTMACPVALGGCGFLAAFEATKEQMQDFEAGKNIADAFPHLSRIDRERFISGFCGPCFDKHFPPEPEGI